MEKGYALNTSLDDNHPLKLQVDECIGGWANLIDLIDLLLILHVSFVKRFLENWISQ